MRTDKRLTESGMVLITMVMILFMLGTILLLSISDLQQQWQRQLFYEKRYYHHYNHAASALSWARQQRWSIPTENWICQQESSLKLLACIKRSSHLGLTLLKGVSPTLPLYQLMKYLPDGSLEFEKGHWLDFCPESREVDCE